MTECLPTLLPDEILTLIQQGFDVVDGRQSIVRAIRRCRDNGGGAAAAVLVDVFSSWRLCRGFA